VSPVILLVTASGAGKGSADAIGASIRVNGTRPFGDRRDANISGFVQEVAWVPLSIDPPPRAGRGTELSARGAANQHRGRGSVARGEHRSQLEAQFPDTTRVSAPA
jgi:hypothetical protein